ncbi:cupin domain-containing protein [Desulfosediminicola flagellatus]|uniref:cupin domain-containing protein n=1 Tax=Desulfosediminicola flagellatus TaxID=2569541 RepID=UPI0010ABFF01|nr:cupin domain-containing protein [Desulfosediminicola flagellatus]
MVDAYTIAHFDFDNLPWLTSPRNALQLQGVALGFIKIPPEDGYTFTHTHREQEEVYIVIEGSGTIAINDELLDLTPGDVIRVSPNAKRALKAGGDGLFAICAGAVPAGFPKNPQSRYMIDDGVPDYDDIPPWHRDKREVVEKNMILKQRMLKSQLKRKKRNE